MHIVVLPASGLEGTDYRKIEADTNSPSSRFGHTASVIDDQIYVHGGCDTIGGAPISENGIVWVYDTTFNKWSRIVPDNQSATPTDRVHHASVATDHPQKPFRRTDEGTAPQAPLDPSRADILPEPEPANTYGTFIIYGGAGDTQSNTDMYTFDIATKTWSELQNPPVPAGSTPSPTLAMVGQRLYTFSAGQTHYMDLGKATFSDKGGQGELGVMPLGPWTALPVDVEGHESGPAERNGAALIPVTTGQGRNYLVLIGGDASSGLEGASTAAEPLQDIWVLQLKPEGMTAASFKDATRMAIGTTTRENRWSECKYYGPKDVLVQEGQTGRGIGDRCGFAVSRDPEIDGNSILLWGGRSSNGNICGDGLLITISI